MAGAEEAYMEPLPNLGNMEVADIDHLLEIELQHGIQPESEDELPNDDFDPLLMYVD